jgi:DNA-binding XRE family transcriptional regulator
MTSASSAPTKYQRGVQHLRPELLKRIKQEMEKDPTLTKTALAARVGVSRQTVHAYLRGLPQAAAEAAVKAEESRTTAITTTHVDLISAVGRAVEDVQQEIDKLRAGPTSPGASGVIFRGFGTLERLWRLLGELLGQVSPPQPQQNVYINQVTALLNRPVDLSALSSSARTLPGLGDDDAPTE